MSASLGFTMSKMPRFTNMSGSVGATTSGEQRRRKSPPIQSDGPTVQSLNTFMNSKTKMKTNRPAAATPPPPPPTPCKKDCILDEEEGQQHHGVFATCRLDLVDTNNGERISSAGERVYLVYPMKNSNDESGVSMRVKRVNAKTGQLSYAWVTIFSSTDDEYHVTDFSLIP